MTALLSDFFITEKKPTWKMSLLVICEILNHFVNKVTTDNKYYFTYSENFHQPI